MSILDKIKEYVGSAEVGTAVYRPKTDYKGKLPTKTVKLGSKGKDVEKCQQFLNWSLNAKLAVDGDFGEKTKKATMTFQKRYGRKASGDFGWRTRMLACCQIQAVWMRKASYGSYKPVTKEHTKSHGTCVTYVGVVLQRYGLLKSGQYIWHNGRGYGTGKVYGVPDTMKVTYMGNKTLKSLKSKLKGGDVVLLDDNKSGKEGSGGHIFIITDKWDSKGNPYIWDVAPDMTCEKTGAPRKYNGSRKVLAIVRPKK